ncbi:MAG: hypothetical protein LWW88_02845 [Acinetobacter sp.]|uniref:hypothetical protein n=1 Tax=Acinetobacter sp. TaxID=472 RepID=UPI002585FFB7|nr:hypothetical protein [Acinetobacter sp.]MCE1270494.1 hypothetical protein [Acinetobacter sp.]
MAQTIKRSDIAKMNKALDKYFEKQNSDELTISQWVNANAEFILEKINQGKTASDFVNALKNEFGIEVGLASFRGYLKKLKTPTMTTPLNQSSIDKSKSQDVGVPNEKTSTLSLNKKDGVMHEGVA